MKLVLFDVDGTLSLTTGVDRGCYVRAFAALGIEGIDTDWSSYPSCTDWSIGAEILARDGRQATEEELARARERLVAELDATLAREPAAFAAVPGAASALERVRREPGWAVAVATGAWRGSAEVKLRGAGLDLSWASWGTSDDAPDREGILGAAIERAQTAHGIASFERIVSIGDGSWDVTTARTLGIAFIGVAAGDGSLAELQAAGASHVFPDYRDVDAFIAALDDARAPDRARG